MFLFKPFYIVNLIDLTIKFCINQQNFYIICVLIHLVLNVYVKNLCAISHYIWVPRLQKNALIDYKFVMWNILEKF